MSRLLPYSSRTATLFPYPTLCRSLNGVVATMIGVTESAACAGGDTVVVQGLCLIGLYGCAIAKARGARRVIAIDSVSDRLEVAKRFGADLVIDVGKTQTADQIGRASCRESVCQYV